MPYRARRYGGVRFPAEMIAHAVRLYLRFALSPAARRPHPPPAQVLGFSGRAAIPEILKVERGPPDVATVDSDRSR